MADAPKFKPPKPFDVYAAVRSVNESARAFDSLQQETLRLADELWETLPKAGGPKGPRPETAYLVEALNRRLAAAGDGAEPTPIAIEIFEALGFEGEQAKSKADHLVRTLRGELQRF